MESEQSTLVETFWRANPSYWIAISNQAKADKEIYEKFHEYDWRKETDLGKVIYLDQFMRHFSRIDKDITEKYMIACRNLACVIAKSLDLSVYSEDDLVWLLMPFKHMKNYSFIFHSINKVLDSGKKLSDFPLLSKFFNDTYRKAYTYEKICEGIKLVDTTKFTYDSKLICDYYPESYQTDDFILNDIDDLNGLMNLVKKYVKHECTVSLSGGVDSMVLCALLKLCKIKFNAIHIVYGNRKESEDELAFISHYCYKLSIPLYTYRIEHLKRGIMDREFYEDMTRSIRFSCYRGLTYAEVNHTLVEMGKPFDNKYLNRDILLGHIQEDVVENIWTNFAKGQHLDNLGKMEITMIENGVTIIRPFLEASKSDIYKASELLGIPYLKNTTPSWSNRGKFREKFYKATHEQYGESVDKKVIEVAERLSSQANLINKLLYEPIYKSWNPETKSIDITSACKAEIDAESWSQILTHISHNFLSISKPTIHACTNFTSRINKLVGNVGMYKYDFKKDMKATILVGDKDIMMLFN
jgi:tRNA(Ile)-lysidine synthetase-like protein